ncbi:hypothetical protein Lalb_Chr02g0145661 [Lupinus albus]|uniref:Uncharacterized protein n=1 Tax=Lupinus albus TaxID=3870 RepID=A0A6A4QY41_LUPAL|nr:hypothetical protein Lalb_Chr02g0145661 [Lupinus albus]
MGHEVYIFYNFDVILGFFFPPQSSIPLNPNFNWFIQFSLFCSKSITISPPQTFGRMKILMIRTASFGLSATNITLSSSSSSLFTSSTTSLFLKHNNVSFSSTTPFCRVSVSYYAIPLIHENITP